MKKWQIITLSILIFIFLSGRLFYDRVQNSKEEKQLYVEQLNFDISGEIDSVTVFRKGVGFILFHLTRGDVDESHENTLNEKLKYNGNLRFLVFEPNDKIEIRTDRPELYSPGDSVYIDTDKDRIVIYRNGQEVSRDKVTSYLRGRLF